MRINKQNRNFPVFFVSKVFIFLSSICFFVACKAKQDWREEYNKNKNTKTIVKDDVKIKKVNTPSSISEISKILDVNESKLKNKELYHFIINWYGTPYKYGGITHNGVDCSGFTNILFKEIYKKQLPRSSKDIAENIKRKYTKDLEEGDLVFFSFGKNKTINHVGVYLHNNMFVHASTSNGVIISNLTEPYYGNFLVRCGTFKAD